MGSYTIYSYNCQECGTRVVGARHVDRCLFCLKTVCRRCKQDGICPTCGNFFESDEERRQYISLLRSGAWGATLACVVPCIALSVGVPLLFSSLMTGIFGWQHYLILAILCVGIPLLCSFGVKKGKAHNAEVQAFKQGILTRAKQHASQSFSPYNTQQFPSVTPPISPAIIDPVQPVAPASPPAISGPIIARPLSQQIPATKAPIPSGMKVCAHCGGELRSDAKFCNRCGEKCE